MTAERCPITELYPDQCSCPMHRGGAAARQHDSLVGIVGAIRDPLSMVHRLNCTHYAQPHAEPEWSSPREQMTAAEAQALVSRFDLAVCLSCEPNVTEQPGRRARRG